MNTDMGIDPRALANAILDMADMRQIEVSNLSLNKLLFFAHADWLVSTSKRLSSLSFEAWQYGPVIPLIYHQFKHLDCQAIKERATRIDIETGDDVVVTYDHIGAALNCLEVVLLVYGRLTPSQLVQISHSKGGAWDIVWNSAPSDKFGMVIPDSLIAEVSKVSQPRGQRINVN